MGQHRDELSGAPALPAAAANVVAEMVQSGRYRAVLWAGGYPGHAPHSRSDVDLYAIAAAPLAEHWFMERVVGRRVELTAYTLPEWQAILARPYRHPKHHYTFAHGRVLHDPDRLCAPLAELVAATLAGWRATGQQLEQLRVGVAIQHDKTAGYRERGMPLHLRYHAVGVVHLACELLVTAWDGYAVDGGKNLTRVLGDPGCPPAVQHLLQTLLTSPETGEMAAAALALCEECLALTGGPVDRYHGGIPR